MRSAGIRRTVDGFRCCLSQCQTLLNSLRGRKDRATFFYWSLLTKYIPRQHHARGVCRSNLGTISNGSRSTSRMSRERFSLSAMAFDPIFRWLQEAVIPRNPHNLDIFQPARSAYADDLAVAAPSFRNLMTALSPAFQSVDNIAGLSLNYRKCCWVQYGTEARKSLCIRISENCTEFREMQLVRYAKLIGTMIGPDGYLHRWTAPRKKFIQRVRQINASTISVVQRLCDLKIYAISVLSFYWICLCT